jgi:5-methylcytosine-specific restriction endonuclease McrA
MDDEARRLRRNEYMRAWLRRHPDEVRARRARYNAEHRDEIRGKKRRFHEAHREELNAARREARRADPRLSAAYNANKTARSMGQSERISWRDLPEGPWCCTYCGDPCRGWDHVVPFVRGGLNLATNLVPCCQPCNSSKNNRLVSEWPGRLAEEERLAAKRASRLADSHRHKERNTRYRAEHRAEAAERQRRYQARKKANHQLSPSPR